MWYIYYIFISIHVKLIFELIRVTCVVFSCTKEDKRIAKMKRDERGRAVQIVKYAEV